MDTAEGAQTLIRLLRPYAPDAEITAVHDTQLVLAAGGLTAGIAVISGTGSVAWGKRADGAVARVGVGDTFSGTTAVATVFPDLLSDMPFLCPTGATRPMRCPGNSPRNAASPNPHNYSTISTPTPSGGIGPRWRGLFSISPLPATRPPR